MAATNPVGANGTGNTPGENDNALQRHKWLAVMINELWRQSNNSEVPMDRLELNIPQQVADVAVGMCWALSPEEYEDMRVSTTQALEGNGHSPCHEQHKYILENLPSWIEDFKTGPERREHPSQRPHFVHTQDSRSSRSPFIDLKWPLTRKERIQELDELYPLYSHTPQAQNIIAAKKYHSQFPTNQIVPAAIIIFMEGKQIDESEVSLYSSQPWCEGIDDVFLAGDPVQLPVPYSPLGPPSNVTGSCESTYVTRAEDSHMYKLTAEVRLLANSGGNGYCFTADVHYDSGCSSMTVPLSDLDALLAPGSFELLPRVVTNTATGRSRDRQIYLQVRVLSQDATKELIPWREVRCNAYDNISRRILRAPLEQECFVANQPFRQRLYLTHTKAQLCRIPKT